MSLAHYMRHYATSLSQVASLMVLSGVVFIILFAVVVFMLRIWLRQRWRSTCTIDGKRTPSVAFFHPYCNAGGGGERVLWVAVRSLQRKYPNIHCVVYTGDTDATPEEILAKVRQRFNIALPAGVHFVFLKSRSWVEASKYPLLTLLGQSFGSVVLGMEALARFVPDIFLDSMGYAFTLPLFRYLGCCQVACYVHYPTISTDMLSKVAQRVTAHNNASFISRSPLLSSFKLAYYKIFAYMYGVAGKRSSLVMVNSTWTLGHISSLWKAPDRTHILYPPCDISDLVQIPLVPDGGRAKQVLSLGQFRPEKDHPLQLRAFHKFLQSCPPTDRNQFRLVLVGSCRNSGDDARVKSLEALAKQLEIEDCVVFRLNISFSEVKGLLSDSMVSVHTMWNEHFGISVVEAMAAGCVMLAHNSGGPKMDIVVPHCDRPTGFLADSVDTYANAISQIFASSPEQVRQMQEDARQAVSRFSQENFQDGFLDLVEPLMDKVPC